MVKAVSEDDVVGVSTDSYYENIFKGLDAKMQLLGAESAVAFELGFKKSLFKAGGVVKTVDIGINEMKESFVQLGVIMAGAFEGMFDAIQSGEGALKSLGNAYTGRVEEVDWSCSGCCCIGIGS